MLAPQIKYLEIENNILKLKDLVSKDDIYLETINNRNCDIKIEPFKKYFSKDS